MEMQNVSKAYWIAHVTVTDPDQYKHYAGDAPVAFKKYGASFSGPRRRV